MICVAAVPNAIIKSWNPISHKVIPRFFLNNIIVSNFRQPVSVFVLVFAEVLTGVDTQDYCTLAIQRTPL